MIKKDLIQNSNRKKKNQLPSLHIDKSATTIQSNASTQQYLGRKNSSSFSGKLPFNEKLSYKLKNLPKDISQVKASNFIQKATKCINQPNVIFNLSECIKEQAGKKFDQRGGQINNKQFQQINIFQNNKQQVSTVTNIVNTKTNMTNMTNKLRNSMPLNKKHTKQIKQNFQSQHGSIHIDNQSLYQQRQKRGLSFERIEVLNLAKWIDAQLRKFENVEHLTIQNIIEYKQHIINYGLGKIIDSVKKKCKEQGELLRIFWDNSFKVFDKVLAIISNSSFQKEKEYINEERENRKLYESKIQEIRNQNKQIQNHYKALYEQMKSVIIWNKTLRKQRKRLKIENRILQYRNQTYTQALEEAIDMFLKSVPDFAAVKYSKKIIAKLARQKRSHKKGSHFTKVEQDFKVQAKQYVDSWIRRTGLGYDLDDAVHNDIYITNDDKLMLTNLQDQTKTNDIDIYEYFKLIDTGVQATAEVRQTASQYELLNHPTRIKNRSVITDASYKRNFQVQADQTEIGKELTQISEDCRITNQNKNLLSVPINGSSYQQKKRVKSSNKSNRSNNSNKKINSNKTIISNSNRNSNHNNNSNRNYNTSTAGKYIRSDKKKKSILSTSKLSEKNSNRQIKQASATFNYQAQRSNIAQKMVATAPMAKNKAYQPSSLSRRSKNGSKRDSGYSLKQMPQLKQQKRRNETQPADQKERFSTQFDAISEKHSEQFNFQTDSEKFDRFKSISRTNNGKALATDKNGQALSIKNMMDFEQEEDENERNSLSSHWKRLRQAQIQQGKRTGNLRRSMNFIKTQQSVEAFSLKKLQKKYFNQVYAQSKNGGQVVQERQHLGERVFRRRSFYKKGKVVFFENSQGMEESKNTQKTNLYHGINNRLYHPKSRAICQEESDKIDIISKSMAIPSNLAKSKTYQASRQMFKQLAQGCKHNYRQPPKNKQFFNASLSSISKKASQLFSDYIRQIRREKQGIVNECEKTYYPLHMILMDKMNYKHGLKQIADKKIKDFIEKIVSFAPVSEKISLYSLLFGMQQQNVGADQLLIYLKCLVYLQKKQQPLSSSIHVLLKDTTNFAQKAITDKELVDQHLFTIAKEFLDTEGIQIVTQQVNDYFQLNPLYPNVQKISEIMIRCLLRRKCIRKDCQQFYRICLKNGNIFSNIYRILKIYQDYHELEQRKRKFRRLSKVKKTINLNIVSIMQEFIKRSDTIDQIYGKSISFDRFRVACLVTNFPSFEDVNSVMEQLATQLDQAYCSWSAVNLGIKKGKDDKSVDLKKYSKKKAEFLTNVCTKWKINNKMIAFEKSENNQNVWRWDVAKVTFQHSENNIKNCIGKLSIFNNQIQNFMFSIATKADKQNNEILNTQTKLSSKQINN